MAAPSSEAGFVDAQLRERVCSPPGVEATAELALPADVPLPDRWQLRTIRASVPALAGYTLQGVWAACQRAKVRLRQARPRLYSPDPDYAAKRDHLCSVLHEMAADPQRTVVVFLDEMGYMRWPEPARTYARAAPAPPPRTQPAGKEAKHRVAGMLDAYSGRVLFVDGHDAGRARLAQLYRTLDRAYPLAERIYVVQDNWPIHAHPDLDAQVAQLPRITRVWLPLAAHWLNPIEKLWRKLRQEVLRLHRQASDWVGLHRVVRSYLDQFAEASPDLLDYVGLLGDGLLARARRGEPVTDLRC